MKPTSLLALLFLVAVSISAQAWESMPGRMDDVKQAILNADPSSYEIVISGGVAALYWKNSKSTAFFYDDEIATLKSIAAQANKKPIQVVGATSDDILFKAGLEKPLTPAEREALRQKYEAQRSGQGPAAMEPERPVKKVATSGSLQNEANCMAGIVAASTTRTFGLSPVHTRANVVFTL